MNTIYEVHPTPDKFYRAKYVEHNGRKFRLVCKTSNGDPCGFKTNKCLQVMTSDGDWSNVVDCNMIGVPYQNNYVHSLSDENKYSDNLFKKFEEFIEKVY